MGREESALATTMHIWKGHEVFLLQHSSHSLHRTPLGVIAKDSMRQNHSARIQVRSLAYPSHDPLPLSRTPPALPAPRK